MSDVQKLSLTVLHVVSEFLAQLPADQVDDLANGTARLAIIPKGANEPLQLGPMSAAKKRTPAAPKAAPAPSPETLALKEQLDAMRTREGAQTLLNARSVGDLRKLATAYGMRNVSSTPKKELVPDLVEFTVGNKLDSDAVRGL